MASVDEKVQSLFKIVQTKKKEIEKLEKPKWLTNCSFSYSEDSPQRMNLQVVSDIDTLVKMYAFIAEKQTFYMEAINRLGLDLTPKWMGFPMNDWRDDISTRINKVQIKKKKDELESLEKRLDSLISPELKQQMELDAIMKALEK